MTEAIRTAEQRCIKLVTMAETQAKDQRIRLQAEIKSLQQKLSAKENSNQRLVEELSADLEKYSKQLAEGIRLFESRHNEVTELLRRTSKNRDEVESRAIARIKDVSQQLFAEQRKERRTKIFEVLKTGVIAPPPEDEEDLPFSTRAVHQYIRGAVEALKNFTAHTVEGLQELLRNEEHKRKGYLLNEERAVFRTTLTRLCPPFVGYPNDVDQLSSSPGGGSGSGSSENLISVETVNQVLLKRLCDDRETRYAFCVSRMDEINDAQTQLLREIAQSSSEQTRTSVQQLMNIPLAEPVSSRAASFSAGPAAAESDPLASTQVLSRWKSAAAEAAGGLTKSKSSLATVVRALQQQRISAARDAPPIHRFVVAVNSVDERIIQKLIEQNAEDFASAQGEFAFKLEQLVRKSASEREVNYYQNVTVFSLDSLQSELTHKELVQRFVNERDRDVAEKFESELSQRDQLINTLNSHIAKLGRDNAGLVAEVAQKQREIRMLHDTIKSQQTTQRIQTQLRTELRQVKYTINEESFGEMWQESVLKLREHSVRELQNENLRFIAKINTLVKRQRGDDAQLETLYEARMHSVVKEMDLDHKAKVAIMQKRFSIEKKHLELDWQERLERERREHEIDLEQWRDFYKSEYEARVNELNRLYDERQRAWDARRSEMEEFFNLKIVQMERRVKARENEIDVRAAERFAQCKAHFESLSDDLRRKYAEREKVLDAEKLQAQANFERKVNEKVMQLRSEFESIGQKLQETVLLFILQQRQAFEEYREKEMQTFTQFSQITDKINSYQHNELIRDAHRHHERVVKQIRDTHVKNLDTQAKNFEMEFASIEEDGAARMIQVKNNLDGALRLTQDLRVEQDEQLWNTVHQKIVAAEEETIKRRSEAELLVQQRYRDIVEQVEALLNKDFAAARTAYEREHRLRTSFLQKYCVYYHKIELNVEQCIWEETAERNMIEREFFTLLYSMALNTVAERQTLQFVVKENARPFDPIGVISIDDMREVRESYETRIADQQKVFRSITKDVLSGFEAQFKANYSRLTKMEDVFNQRLEVLAVALQERFKVYYSSRQFLVEGELKRVATLGESLFAAVHTISSQHQPPGGGSRGGARGEQQDQASRNPTVQFSASDIRVIEYFVSMKALLSKAMSEFEEKLEAKFETSERSRADTMKSMHVEYVNVTSSLLKQLEVTKRNWDFSELCLQQARQQLSLEGPEYERAARLCNDLSEYISQLQKSRDVKGWARIAASPASGAAPSSGDSAAAANERTYEELKLFVPRRILNDYVRLKEKQYCLEYVRSIRDDPSWKQQQQQQQSADD